MMDPLCKKVDILTSSVRFAIEGASNREIDTNVNNLVVNDNYDPLKGRKVISRST